MACNGITSTPILIEICQADLESKSEEPQTDRYCRPYTRSYYANRANNASEVGLL